MITEPSPTSGAGVSKPTPPIPKTKIKNEQIATWGRQLGLSEKAIAQIQRMNGSDPVRIGNGRRSVRGVFPSSIMECMLNYESRTCEGSYLWLRHADSKINPDRPKMILCQPCWLTIFRQIPGQKNSAFQYPPDFFELTDSWAGFIECKWESDLENSQDPKHPDYDPWRYQRLGPGKWASAPAEAAAKFYDLSHRIWVMSRHRTQLIANLQFLSEYFEPPTDNYHQASADRIKALVRNEPGIQLRRIQDTLRTEEMDTLFFCIARQELYIDIEREPIAPNYTARVFPNVECSAATRRMESAQAESDAAGDSKAVESDPEFVVDVGTELIRDKAAMVIVRSIPSENFVELRNTETGKVSSMTLTELEAEVVSGTVRQTKASVAPPTDTASGEEKWRLVDPDEWVVMNKRYTDIERFLDARSRKRLAKTDRPTRNQSRWIQRCRAARSVYGAGFEILGLQPEPRSGNTNPKLDKDVLQILDTTITDNYTDKQAPSAELVWGICTKKCEAFSPPLTAPSRKTVLEHIKKRDPQDTVESREGPKAAYAIGIPYWNEESDGLPVDGEYAWGVAHIDHTQLDAETEATADGLSLGRPWLTTMVAPRQRRLLAYWLSYEEPSYRSCMSVIRECVRRHRRLPAIIVTDNGKEFTGHYFAYLMRRFRIVHMFRPPATPRFGAYLERFNRLINSKLIHNLPGNTKATLRVRELVRAHDPKRLATLSLTDLDLVVEEFAHDWLEAQPDKITGLTPRQAYEADLRMGGPRSHKIVIPNREFRILTCPAPKSVLAMVRRDGIKISHLYYRCRQLRDAVGRKVPVRFDPYDLSVVYVRLNREWIDCHCQSFRALFKGLSQREIQLATTRLLAGCQTLQEKRRKISAKSLADFFSTRNLLPETQKARKRAQANARARSRKERAEESQSTPAPSEVKGVSPPSPAPKPPRRAPRILNITTK